MGIQDERHDTHHHYHFLHRKLIITLSPLSLSLTRRKVAQMKSEKSNEAWTRTTTNCYQQNCVEGEVILHEIHAAIAHNVESFSHYTKYFTYNRSGCCCSRCFGCRHTLRSLLPCVLSTEETTERALWWSKSWLRFGKLIIAQECQPRQWFIDDVRIDFFLLLHFRHNFDTSFRSCQVRESLSPPLTPLSLAMWSLPWLIHEKFSFLCDCAL